MPKVRITVIRKAFYADLADAYLSDGRSAGACPIHEEGQSFVYEGGAQMPEGFCPWAWLDIYQSVATLSACGFDNDWYSRGDLRIRCCSDGIRPVTFLLEAMTDEDRE